MCFIVSLLVIPVVGLCLVFGIVGVFRLCFGFSGLVVVWLFARRGWLVWLLILLD